MGDVKLEFVRYYPTGHRYSMRIDGKRFDCIDADMDGVIDETLVNESDLRSKQSWVSLGTAHADVAQPVVDRFRRELPGELARVKESFRGARRMTKSLSWRDSPTQCLFEKAILQRATHREGERRVAVSRYDFNGDGKIDWYLGIHGKTGVQISAVIYLPFLSEERCSGIDVRRVGVAQYLRLLDEERSPRAHPDYDEVPNEEGKSLISRMRLQRGARKVTIERRQLPQKRMFGGGRLVRGGGSRGFSSAPSSGQSRSAIFGVSATVIRSAEEIPEPPEPPKTPNIPEIPLAKDPY